MKCKLVDVFADKKLSGNGLTIFYDIKELSKDEMLSLTCEMRQFESIFVFPCKDKYIARIFTMEEELDFAGHPLIGLAYHLHEEYGDDKKHEWKIQLNKKIVTLRSQFSHGLFAASMDQGKPEYLKVLSKKESEFFVSALNLKKEDLAPYPMEVISTGLPYLILPIKKGIEKAKIVVDNLEEMLLKYGAKFLYLLDISSIEGRTWDNSGLMEDIATGSAAGPCAAYLYKHNIIDDCKVVINQGRFLKRQSKIHVDLKINSSDINKILVSGNVVKVADMNFCDF